MIEFARALLGPGRMPRGKVLRLYVPQGDEHVPAAELRREHVGKDGTTRYILYAVGPEGGLEETHDIYVRDGRITVIDMAHEPPKLVTRRRGRRATIRNGSAISVYVAVEDA